MFQNLNTKTVVNKVAKKEIIVSSDSDNESVSGDESDIIVTKKKVIKDNKSGESCGVLLDNNPKSGSKNKVIKVKKEDNVDEKNLSTVVKPKKKSKNELFKEDQKIFFDRMKKIVGVKDTNQSFILKDVTKEEEEKMINDLLEGMKKYYDSNMSRGISGKDSKTLLAIVRKLCDFHGYDLIKKEIKTSDDRWFQYYIVSQE
jgi:hypothetical protein